MLVLFKKKKKNTAFYFGKEKIYTCVWLIMQSCIEWMKSLVCKWRLPHALVLFWRICYTQMCMPVNIFINMHDLESPPQTLVNGLYIIIYMYAFDCIFLFVFVWHILEMPSWKSLLQFTNSFPISREEAPHWQQCSTDLSINSPPPMCKCIVIQEHSFTLHILC